GSQTPGQTPSTGGSQTPGQTPSTGGSQTPGQTPSTGGSQTPGQTPSTGGSQTPVNSIGQAVIQAGLKYLGTPYEYASSRSTKTTMDCSEFVMWAYREGAGIDMGRGGATSEFNYVKAHGTYYYDKSKLQPGDLIWFMKYRGWKASDYAGIDASSQPIQHIGIYMGNNKVLHTFGAGGVKITDLEGTHWGYRFIKAGRPY
ncbi:NlpC/P60 family protein, partial [Brevibacillus ginsengisoli]|uniref:C40 family peptidase n=1 Tax=Brevibacillus ginsengisoli TaxID=363854 RepID=UPI003CEFA0D4